MSEKTCRQCRQYTRCMERSRMYPCTDFKRTRWGERNMSDAEITVMIAIAWMMLLIPAFLLPT
ncbi:MAG: hypothetical protein QM793_06625 [Muricomes sp.]